MMDGTPLKTTAVRSAIWFLFVICCAASGSRIAADDCNQNGIEDVDDVLQATSDDCNANSVPDECEDIPIQLGRGTQVLELEQPPRVTVAIDLNADTRADLVALTRENDMASVAVFLNAGDREFIALDVIEVAAPAYTLTAAHLDSDALPDLVVGAFLDTIVLKGAGGGAFEAAVHYPSAFDARYATVGDITGDGLPDIVAANRSENTVSVLPNLGDGTFGASTEYPVGENPRDAGTADFDGDGTVDVYTINRNSRDVSVVLNRGNRLDDPVSYPLDGSFPSFGRAVDLNHDSAPDLVVTTSRAVYVLLNRGDGEFLTPVPYAARVPRSLEIDDFNGDGSPDIVISTVPDPSTILVLLNDGVGGFSVGVRPGLFPTVPTSLAGEDFNDDGVTDLALTTSIPRAVHFLWSGDRTFLSFDSKTFPATGRPHSGIVADVDADGDLDAVGCSTHTGTFSTLRNNDGVFEMERGYNFGGEHPQSVAVGDLNHDGRPDAVTCDNLDHHVWVHIADDNNGYLPPERILVGGAPINIKLADFDRDGNLDTVTSNQGQSVVSVLFGDGSGSLGSHVQYRVGSRPKAAVAVDLDGDDWPDIATANEAATHISVLINRGDGTFEDVREYEATAPAGHIASGDVDGDGDVDLVTSNQARVLASVFLNRGNGTFDPPLDYTTEHGGYSIEVADVDSDGFLDLVTANEGRATVSVLLGNGQGLFLHPIVFNAGVGLRFAMPADMDGDGDVDVVTVDRGGGSLTMLTNTTPRPLEVDYVDRLCTGLDFHELSAAAGATGEVRRFVKFTVPMESSALPGVTFQNTRRFELHEDFLSTVFADEFPDLTPKLYTDLVGTRATRRYFVGTISLIQKAEGRVFGFSVFARWNDPAEALSVNEVRDLYNKLKEAFLLEPFAYFPNSRAALEVASEWVDPGFPVQTDVTSTPSTDYEPYTLGVSFGRVRLLDRDAFDQINETGGLSFQDIVVLDHAPRDIEGVVGGVVTAEPQGELSHVSVRTNRRGTPNAFSATALETFVPLADHLVRLDVSCAGLAASAATPEDAEAFWASSRPTLSVSPSLDPDFSAIPTLAEIAVMDSDPGAPPVESRFGGKASGLARLQTVLDGPNAQYQEQGFAIPVHYYLEFMRTNSLPSALDPARDVTYQQYVEELLGSGEFQTNSRFRFDALERLRDHMRSESVIEPALVQQLAGRISEVFGTTTSRVRFRSSSNLEDSIEFNGAGLYDSTSVCAEDDLDADATGPSHCDPTRENERGVARGLRRVWSSLWNFRAYEERSFFGIDQEIAAMGILVNRAFVDERVNGVAFTGNPTNPLDRRYVITAQLGEESVVSPEPGVLPEKNLLDVQDGVVVSIRRAVSSSLVPRGVHVLSDAELEELGALLWHIDQSYPIDTGEHARDDVVLDLEFKIEADGPLAVKQVRPFLLSTPEPPTPAFELVIPPGTMACGMFDIGREVREEYERKSTLELQPGTFRLPADAELEPLELIGELRFGPDRALATPQGPGELNVRRVAAGDCESFFRFEYAQDFLLPSGEELRVELSQLDFQPGTVSRTLDAEALTDSVFLRANVRRGESFVDVVYSACGHPTLPAWDVRFDLADGNSAQLTERFRPELFRDFGAASLVDAVVGIDGAQRRVTDYWELVYSSTRHNEHVSYWVVFEPAATVEGQASPVRALELHAPVEHENLQAEAFYLDEQFNILSSVEVTTFAKEEITALPTPFRRGDVNADTALGLDDAMSLLLYLFRGAEPPMCLKSGDANDDGRLNVSDGVRILLRLFAGAPPLPAPAASCGVDLTTDDLECREHAACP